MRFFTFSCSLVLSSVVAVLCSSSYQATREDQPPSRHDRFAGKDSSPAILSIDDLAAAIGSAVAVRDDGQDTKTLKADILASRRPVVLLIASDVIIDEDLSAIAECSKGAIIAVLAQSQQSAITLDESSLARAKSLHSVPVLAMPKDVLLTIAANAHRDSRALHGLYIFDTRGATIWFASTPSWHSLCSEISLVVATLKTVAEVDSRRPPPFETSETRSSGNGSNSGPAGTPHSNTAKPSSGSLMTVPVDSHSAKPIRFADVIKATDNRGTLVNFWATWCDPCKREFPELALLVAENKHVFRYVGVVTDGASAPGAKEKIDAISPSSLRRGQYALRDVSDINEIFPTRAYAAPRDVIVPLFALFDSRGRLVFKCEGSILDEQNASLLGKALAKLSTAGTHE
ncbi:MAG TPA: TlpA disulfide reductase family protein [Thermoanaerobaculia bacterium]|nr:TlpA disulfide reductase family protein [Thermoanaerobaculia bacterium]